MSASGPNSGPQGKRRADDQLRPAREQAHQAFSFPNPHTACVGGKNSPAFAQNYILVLFLEGLNWPGVQFRVGSEP